jgi:hypothetical protein
VQAKYLISTVWTYVWALGAIVASTMIVPLAFAVLFYLLTLVENLVFHSGRPANVWDALAAAAAWISFIRPAG